MARTPGVSEMRPMLPNWILIGAPKAGTSSLFQWLADHPQVCGSQEKETYYFVDPGTHMFVASQNFATRGLAGYEALFAHGDPQARIVLEATPGYMYHRTPLRELPQLPSQPHFIVLLREPVAQIRSLFRYFQQNWAWIPRSMTFAEFVEAADQGEATFKGNELASGALKNANYLEALRQWRDTCGAERLHVHLFEDMVSDPRRFMIRLSNTLGIDPSFYESYDFPVENETYVARSGLLQALNIRLRALIPQGRIYHLLRSAYRAVNTRPAQKPTGPLPFEEAATEQMLSQRYLATLPILEREFDLDLSSWRRTMEARLASPGDAVPSLSASADGGAGSANSPGLHQA